MKNNRLSEAENGGMKRGKLYGKVHALREFLYPENVSCRLCGKEVFEAHFCPECRDRLPYNTVYCLRCGRGVHRTGYCAECKREMPLYSVARSLFRYEGDVRRLVMDLKENEPARSLAGMFASELLPVLRYEFPDAQMLTFVPCGEETLERRGYNQAERLAVEIGRVSGLDVVGLFSQEKQVAEQKMLSKRDRRRNLQGVFRLRNRAVVRDKNIVIVDDVLTTGATVESLAELLWDAKVRRVYVLTVAATPVER